MSQRGKDGSGYICRHFTPLIKAFQKFAFLPGQTEFFLLYIYLIRYKIGKPVYPLLYTFFFWSFNLVILKKIIKEGGAFGVHILYKNQSAPLPV